MKSIKKLLAIVLAIVIMVSCFAFSASASTTTTYYTTRVALLMVTNDNFDYSNEPFITLEFLKMAGVLERIGDFGGNFSYSHNGTIIYTFKTLNTNGKYYGYPNAYATDSDDFTYEITQADKDRNYTGTKLEGKLTDLLKADYLIVHVSTNPVIDVSEKYMDAYLKETIISLPMDISKNLLENSTLSIDEVYNLARIYSVGSNVVTETGSCGMEQSGEDMVITNKDGKPLFSFVFSGQSFDLTLASGVTYEDNISWTNDKTMDETKGNSLYMKGLYYSSITFIHGKEYTADDASWIKGSSDDKSIEFNAAMADFKFVMVDGNMVDSANFDISEGSITFKPAYLATLSVGDHPVIIGSKDGVAEAVLTINEAPTPTPTPTPEKKTEEPVEEETTTEPVEKETTTEPVEEETTTKPVEEKTTTEPVEEEPEVVADTSDNTVIGEFVALGTVAAAGFISLKKKED